ncbi:hypothetical protein K438DRAFT_2028101 [Mycena galopus ATCC 62051]|nr:hypothetical protein K438DRAFT_2028101 [Mycena galopus ATCC 62051]
MGRPHGRGPSNDAIDAHDGQPYTLALRTLTTDVWECDVGVGRADAGDGAAGEASLEPRVRVAVRAGAADAGGRWSASDSASPTTAEKIKIITTPRLSFVRGLRDEFLHHHDAGLGGGIGRLNEGSDFRCTAELTHPAYTTFIENTYRVCKTLVDDPYA